MVIGLKTVFEVRVDVELRRKTNRTDLDDRFFQFKKTGRLLFFYGINMNFYSQNQNYGSE